MHHNFLVLTVKKLLKSMHTYGSYRKIKTRVSLFWTTRYIPYVLSKNYKCKYCGKCSYKVLNMPIFIIFIMKIVHKVH